MRWLLFFFFLRQNHLQELEGQLGVGGGESLKRGRY